MPVPLMADANVLGRLAVKTSPRLAAMLMASHHSGMPLMATPHRAGASPAASLVLSPSNPLARWAAHAESAVTAARAGFAAARAFALMQAPAAPAPRTSTSRISDLYKRLLGEGTSIPRPRSLVEQVEAAQPAEAGRSARVLDQAEGAKPDRTTELMALTALVVGVAYGDQVDRASTGGSFDVTVFRNLSGAADVIAPGQSLASLDPVRMRAVLTAGLQSSNAAFLGHMKDMGRVAHSMAKASSLAPDGRSVAAEFTDGGTFSQTAFLKKTMGSSGSVAQVAGATPVGAKTMLLQAAAEKAQELLPEMKRQGGVHVGLQARVLRSLTERLSELDALQAPADQPMAPGVR
jgi:hypothetical protein